MVFSVLGFICAGMKARIKLGTLRNKGQPVTMCCNRKRGTDELM